MSTAGREDEEEDQLSLDQVLDRLYDFGDAASKKNLKSQKKKKRKSCELDLEEREEQEEEQEVVRDVNGDTKDSGEDDLHLGRRREKTRKGSADVVEQTARPVPQTRQVEVVTFRDPTRRAKTTQHTPGTFWDPTRRAKTTQHTPGTFWDPTRRAKTTQQHTPAPPDIISTVPQKTVQKTSDKTEHLSLEKARLEVHRFGITGYRKEQQRVFEQDRAIMLGARPPKKDYVNYKVLQQQVKDKKQKSKDEAQPNLKKSKKRQSKPRDKKKSSGPSGQVGRFKNGVLILSHQDIQKIKGNKGRK